MTGTQFRAALVVRDERGCLERIDWMKKNDLPTRQVRILIDALRGILSSRPRPLFLGTAAILAVLLAQPILAEDVSGDWDITFRVGNDAFVLALTLEQARTGISGAGVLDLSGSGDSVQVSVRSGVVGRHQVRIALEAEPGRLPRLDELRGSWHRAEMSGTLFGSFGSRMFAAVRRHP